MQHNPDQFIDQLVQFQELMMMYNSAIREVTTKLEILNDELSLHKVNPIESIKSRIKEPMSIVEKLHRYGKEISVDAIQESLNDVAGIRVICSFIDDIYKISDMLTKQDDITVIRIKDYIKNPKPNGYRSYHMIVEVPVFFSDHRQMMRVEIQIRTVAMDFWASLEHRLKYKNGIKDAQHIGNELLKCAEVISNTDKEMMNIKNMIELEA
ncbi:MAG: GTP pyrophosphokinase family protein [Anaerovorax sp.]|nr:GTP pyrophosphokinase family protein [Anaerovorax sp.]